MNVLRVILLAGVVLAMIAGCEPSATPTPSATATPLRPLSVQILPHPLRPGVRATLVALGFERGERVSFYLTLPDGTQTGEGQSTADTNGNAAYQLDVSTDWKAGEYVAHVSSRDNASKRAQQRVQLIRQ